MVRASSRTGRTMARSALRTPTPSTEQNVSKNSRNVSDLPGRGDPAEVLDALRGPGRAAREWLVPSRREPEVAVGPKGLTTHEKPAEGELGDLTRRGDPANHVPLLELRGYG